MKGINFRKSLILILFAVALYLAMMSLSVALTKANESHTVLLSDHWDVEIDDERYPDVSYNEYVQSENALRKGDSIICSMIMPDFGDIAFPTIYFHTRKSAVEVYFDGELIYEGETERIPAGEFIGRRTRFVTLPQAYAGKELKIVFLISRDSTGIGYDAPRFGGYQECFRYFIQRYIPALMTGCMLIMYGLIFLFISLFFITISSGLQSGVFSSLICVAMGVWILGYYDLTRVFMSEVHSTFTEYVAFYLLLPLFLLLWGQMYRGMRILIPMGIAGVLIVALLATLHSIRIIHIDTVAPAYYILLIFAFIITIYRMIRYRRHSGGSLDWNVQELGILMMLFTMLLYLIVYNIQSLTGLKEDMFTMFIPVIGASGFVISQMLFYFIHVSEAYARRKEFAELSHLAYVDMLTGLPNRKAAMNVFDNLDHTRTDYTILSLDLNGLKQVNDRYGHLEGDEMLKNTANVLNECFSDIGFRARLSGDEYLVIVQNTEKAVIEERIEKMRSRFAELTAANPNRVYSISCGYANRTADQVSSAGEAFRIADTRMYEEKRAYYEEKRAGGATPSAKPKKGERQTNEGGG